MLKTKNKYVFFYDGRIKECTKCNRLLTIDNFIKDKTKPHGIYSSCKACYKLAKGSMSVRIPAKERDCAICGISFIPRHYQIDNLHGVVCSVQCRHKYVALKRRGKTQKTFRNGYVLSRSSVADDLKREHISVVEKNIGRELNRGEVVHHIDCDKANNDLHNLYLCDSSTHMIAHHSLSDLVKDLIANGNIFFDKPDGAYLLRSNYFGKPN